MNNLLKIEENKYKMKFVLLVKKIFTKGEFNVNNFFKNNIFIHNCTNSNEINGKKRNWTTSAF